MGEGIERTFGCIGGVSKNFERNIKTFLKLNKKAGALPRGTQRIARAEDSATRKAPCYQGDKLSYQGASTNSKEPEEDSKNVLEHSKKNRHPSKNRRNSKNFERNIKTFLKLNKKAGALPRGTQRIARAEDSATRKAP
ncbi:hypothetical protein MKX54_15605 [Alkalihalobacillus sp. FSL R5-0424]